ncbi:MAG TPA: SDR family oxidoreductase [Burkholderiales bacterium]|jgi:nucleoside-diphosphate-sugar epimerase|nr:SDR family oxidoreductase [Burkholderiales bacterium]
MNRILVTGSTGFVGRVLCQRLLNNGQSVVATLRTATSASTLPVGVDIKLIGPIDRSTQWGQSLDAVDTIVHLAARVHVMKDAASDPLAAFREVNTLGTENLARQAVAAGVKRLVYVSSIKVNGEGSVGTGRYSEDDPHDPQDPYGVSKSEAEMALQAIATNTGLEVVVIRPPLVYGPEVKGNMLTMLKALRLGVPLPFASIKNRRSLIYVHNLVDAIVSCAHHPGAAGKVYLVSDGEDVSTPELLGRLATALGKKARLFPMPSTGLRLIGNLTGKSKQLDRLLGSLVVDSSKIRRELGWTPPFTLSQGLQTTAKWFQGV